MDETHLVAVGAGLETVGGWRGASGRWSTHRSGARRDLALTRDGDRIAAPGAPSIPLTTTYEIAERALKLGTNDILVRRNDDCRVATVTRSARELEADELAAEAFECGHSPDQPSAMQIGLEGELSPAGWCTKGIMEHALRETRTNAEERLVATVHGFTNLDVLTTSKQSYVYDSTGALRVVITTTEEQDITGSGRANSVTDRTRYGTGIVQTRVYFDEDGAPARTLVQPHVEEARISPAERLLSKCRRYQSIHDAADITDMPWCVSTTTAALIAAHPKDPRASLAAAPACRPSE